MVLHGNVISYQYCSTGFVWDGVRRKGDFLYADDMEVV